MKKYAIVVLSDPSSKTDEALGRVFNALVVANDLKNREMDFKLFFQGTGTRWISVLEDESHPAHGLYSAIKEDITGASMACATVFNATVTSAPLLSEFDIKGIGGATSLVKYMNEGYEILSF